jgi:DNA-binding GntR family transcriptional regulator
VKEIFDLYEFRQKLEEAAVRLGVERAIDNQLAEIERFLEKTSKDVPGRTTLELVALDEEFHEKVMALSGKLRNASHPQKYQPDPIRALG